MGFFYPFLVKRKIFLGLYCENFLNSEDFLRATYNFRRASAAFFRNIGAPEILKFLKVCKFP